MSVWRTVVRVQAIGCMSLAVAMCASMAAGQTSRYYHSTKVPAPVETELESEPAPALPARGHTYRAGSRQQVEAAREAAAQAAEPIIYEEEARQVQPVTSQQALKPMARPGSVARATRTATPSSQSAPHGAVPRSSTPQRVASRPAKPGSRAYSPRVAQTPARPAPGEIIPEGEIISEGEVIPEGAEFMGEPLHAMPMEHDGMHGHYEGGCGHSCGACAGHGCGMGGCSFCDSWRWWHGIDLFAGVQSFEGPLDDGAGGNFGVHEGVNWGVPLWDFYGIGYQLGVRGVHSNFAGDEDSSDDGRNQVFVTTGVFHRASYGRGIQGGVVYDWLSDDYLEDHDFSQIRGEISYLLRCNHEFGLWFSTAVSGEEDEDGFDDLEAVDMYNLFYRRNFAGGGFGRVWVGFSNESDGLVGTDFVVPIADRWSVETNINYLIPEDGTNTDESWAMGISLVWTPAGRGCGTGAGPYKPLFSVADNATLMVREHDED